jgi:pimeloyl-ACP methyl ester carboxylesterase
VTEANLPGFQARFAEICGARMRYFVAGDGEPLLLVHGLGGGASNWVHVAPTLAEERRVLVPDLPGHAGSAPLSGPGTMAAYADCVAELAGHEGMLPAPIVGHSFGALLALWLAMRRPDDVAGVILAGSAGISSTQRLRQAMLIVVGLVKPGRIVTRFRDQVARMAALRQLTFGYWLVADPEALTAEAVEGFLAPQALHSDTWTASRSLAVGDSRTELEGVRCPVLVLWGAADRLVPVEDGLEYARRLRAPLRTIPDCGHLLIGERPDACLEAIHDFLDGYATAAPSKGTSAAAAIPSGGDRN